MTGQVKKVSGKKGRIGWAYIEKKDRKGGRRAVKKAKPVEISLGQRVAKSVGWGEYTLSLPPLPGSLGQCV